MRNAWAVVVLVGLALSAVTVASVTHSSALDVMSVIAATVVPAVSMLLVGREIAGQVDAVQGQVDAVHKQVNGRMSELIAATGQQAPAVAPAPDATDTQEGGTSGG